MSILRTWQMRMAARYYAVRAIMGEDDAKREIERVSKRRSSGASGHGGPRRAGVKLLRKYAMAAARWNARIGKPAPKAAKA